METDATDEKKLTVSESIVQYLELTGRWVPGGLIEDAIHTSTVSKASTVARACRELAEEGVLDRRENQIDGKGPHFVEYRHVPTAVRNERKRFGKGTASMF